MTRVTNFGRKRTYLEAGFAETTEDTLHGAAAIKPDLNNSTSTPVTSPSKKKRRKGKPGEKDGKTVGAVGQSGAGAGEAEIGSKPLANNSSLDVDGKQKMEESKPSAERSKGAVKAKKGKDRRAKERVSQSELRRHKRIAERDAATTCFACREKGHAARDCPSADQNPDGDGGIRNPTLGICYRCGSRRHTLARCKKPVNTSNPLPFASCFVCSGKGHLASSCPQNKSKGIYPNGGCCKLCGDTTHLAKDCGLRKGDTNGSTTIIMGINREAGADEDDFHMFKRRKAEVERDEKVEDKVKRLVDLKAGAHSGVVRSFGTLAAKHTKRVVYF